MDMKTSKRIPPGTPKYHRLTSENRIIIWTLKKEGKSKEDLTGCDSKVLKRSAGGIATRRARSPRFVRVLL